MGDGAGPQPGVQVLPIDGPGQEAARSRRIAMEANGGSGGSRDVACTGGELTCDGGGGSSGMKSWRGNSNPTLSWKRKSSANEACLRVRHGSPLCALSAIPL